MDCIMRWRASTFHIALAISIEIGLSPANFQLNLLRH
jgi:hypothetical protein